MCGCPIHYFPVSCLLLTGTSYYILPWLPANTQDKILQLIYNREMCGNDMHGDG